MELGDMFFAVSVALTFFRIPLLSFLLFFLFVSIILRVSLFLFEPEVSGYVCILHSFESVKMVSPKS